MPAEPFVYEPFPSTGPSAPPPRQARGADIAVTVVELVLLALAAVLVTIAMWFLGAWVEGSDPDGESAGPLIAFVLVPTWGLWLVALAVSIVLITRKRLAFWVPLVALAVWLLLVLAVGSAAGA